MKQKKYRTPFANAAKQTAYSAVEQGGPDATVVPYAVAVRIERDYRDAVEAIRELVHDMPIQNCEWLHHRKADQGHGLKPCPVEERVYKAMHRVRHVLRAAKLTGH